jgi:alpha-ketoglutarate-dependent taurine dioxygenase
MSSMPAIDVESLERIPDPVAREIVGAVADHGCLLVRQSGGDAVNHSAALSKLGRHLGTAVRHRLSDENGVHPIRSIPGYPSYANTTNADLLLHTDGSFEADPPRFMLISCETPASSGGHTRICFARDIYNMLKSEAPQELQALWRDDSFTIRRDDRKSSKPVFRSMGAGRTAMTFRFGSDVEIEVHPEARAGYERIVKLVSNSDNFIEFKLQSNEILAFDNTAVLHGRTDFPPGSGRVLHGLWLDGRPGGEALPLGFKA